jgi:hypothetical protein
MFGNSFFDQIKFNWSKALFSLSLGAWKGINLLVILPMLPPNFTFFLDRAIAVENQLGTENLVVLKKDSFHKVQLSSIGRWRTPS